MPWLFVVGFLLALFNGCGADQSASTADTNDVTSEFLSVAIGYVYKQNDTEMFFTPDRRLIQKRFFGCKTAILGENVTVTKVPVGLNDTAVRLSYEEADIRSLDAIVTDENCKAEIDAYRAQLPKTQTMLFCRYGQKVLDASCGREELSEFIWN